jgi:DNA-directed RNA polymerase subunit L
MFGVLITHLQEQLLRIEAVGITTYSTKHPQVSGKYCIFFIYILPHPLVPTYTNTTRTLKKLNSVAIVRERTIPLERPPPVGEVSANFCG